MGLPDEEDVIRMLRQIKQESMPPRQSWKQSAKERLVRQAGNVQRKERLSRLSTNLVTFVAAALLAIWINTEKISEKSEPQLAQVLVQQKSAVLGPDWPGTGSVNQKQDLQSREANAPVAVEQPPSAKEANVVKSSKTQSEKTTQTAAAMHTQTTSGRNKTALEEQAERYLHEKLGGQSKQYELDPAHSRPSEGLIAFRRLFHGIPLQENSAVVKVNRYNGEMSLLLYPDVEQPKQLSKPLKQTVPISKAKAAQELAATLRLVYAGRDQLTLQYRPEPNTFIDAKTGKRVISGKAGNTVIVVKGEGKRMTIKDRNEAAAVMNEELGFDVAGKAFANIEKQAILYTWQQGENRMASLKTDDEGSFIGYSLKGEFQQTEKPVSTLQQAQDIALVQLAKFLPATVGEVTLEAVNREDDRTHFLFVPMHQGIPVVDHPLFVTVDMTSGIVTSMEGHFSHLSRKLPDKTAAISLKEAVTRFKQEMPVELVYMTRDEDSPKLVYQIQMDSANPWALDAETGKRAE